MEKSESIKELAAALAKFQATVPKIDLDKEVAVKTKGGYEYNFNYATFANILEKIKVPLSENGLSFSQLVNSDGSVTTLLMHVSGEWISSNLLIIGDKTPQGIGSAITYAKRYSLSSILGICADDDDDANVAQGNEYKLKDNPATKQKEQQHTKRPFFKEKVDDEFLQCLYKVGADKKSKGERFNVFSFLENVYAITPDEIKFVCARLGEYEQAHNLERI